MADSAFPASNAGGTLSDSGAPGGGPTTDISQNAASSPSIRTMRDDLARIHRTNAPDFPKTETGEDDLLGAISEGTPGQDAFPDLPPLVSQEPAAPESLPAWEPEPLPTLPRVGHINDNEPPDIYSRLGTPSETSPMPEVPTPEIPSPPNAEGISVSPSPDASDLDLLGHLDGGLSGEKEIGEITPAPPIAPPEPAPIRPEPAVPPQSQGAGISPLKPEELLALEEEVAAPERESGGPHTKIPGLAIIAGAGGLLLIGAVVGYVTLFRGKTGAPEPAPAATPTPETAGPQEPEALFPIASKQTLIVTDLQTAPVAVQELIAATAPVELSRFSLRLETEGDTRYLSFEETLAALSVTIPNAVRETFDESRFMIFRRGEAGSEKTRIGIAVGLKDAAALIAQRDSFEESLPNDFDTLLRALGKTEESRSPDFQITVYGGLENQFMNFPEPDLSLDYTIDAERGILLIATSRALMYAAIDALP